MDTVRRAFESDVPYIDSLQKKHGKELGFLSRYALTEYVNRYHVSIGCRNGEPACYLLGRGPTLRHPDDARIYQACVQYDARFFALGTLLVNHFIASLPQETEWIALWCAQDIDAGFFWASCDFNAVAWRLGKKQGRRVHLLWVRGLAVPNVPSRFPVPGTTNAGQLRKARIVSRIMPGQTWRDVRASDDPDVLVADWEDPEGPPELVTASKLRPIRARKVIREPERKPERLIPLLSSGQVRMVPARFYENRR